MFRTRDDSYGVTKCSCDWCDCHLRLVCVCLFSLSCCMCRWHHESWCSLHHVFYDRIYCVWRSNQWNTSCTFPHRVHQMIYTKWSELLLWYHWRVYAIVHVGIAWDPEWWNFGILHELYCICFGLGIWMRIVLQCMLNVSFRVKMTGFVHFWRCDWLSDAKCCTVSMGSVVLSLLLVSMCFDISFVLVWCVIWKTGVGFSFLSKLENW